MIIVNTSRLVLRYFREDDSSIFIGYRNNKDLNQFQGWNIPFTYEDWNTFWDQMKENNVHREHNWVQIVLELKETGELIGDIGFKRDYKTVEIGITIRQEFHKMGYAKEALNAMIEYLIYEVKIHRCIALIDTDNISSIKLFESLKFRKEGHHIQSYWDEKKQEWRNEFLYARLKDEFSFN